MKIAKVAAVGLLLASLPVARANAQTNTYRTNVLMNLTFNLTAYEQVYFFFSTNAYTPAAKISKIATAGIIKAVASQARITNHLDNVKLYWRFSWSDPNDVSQDVILRNPGGALMGTNDTVVNNFITVSFPDSVTATQSTSGGKTSTTEYANCNVNLGTSQGAFALHGLATRRLSSLLDGRTLIDPNPYPISFTATVAGSGSVGFHQAEWKGSIIGSGQKVEVEQVSQ